MLSHDRESRDRLGFRDPSGDSSRAGCENGGTPAGRARNRNPPGAGAICSPCDICLAGSSSGPDAWVGTYSRLAGDSSGRGPDFALVSAAAVRSGYSARDSRDCDTESGNEISSS